ncbi:FxsA family protein [Phreatobacter sp.]|uniref:FxsA family protein n=1 Tax=Phreatobacter sp. TaxID=1966341 RepID=UPI003F6FB9D7
MIRPHWLLLGLAALPFAEFAAFFWVAGAIGFAGALFAMIATSVLGILILRGGAIRLIRTLAASGGGVVTVSDRAARDGLFTALAGLLFAIPGFVTDVFAVALLVPVVVSRLSGTPPAEAGRRPAPPGVVDLDPDDWREERNRQPPRRIDGPERP